MCFNAAKNWQMSWYGGVGDTSDYKVKVDPRTTPLSSFTLVGIGEFDKNINSSKYPVVLKIETGTSQDYFVGFNRAVGPNAQNAEADNEVTIIQ
eukprot:14575483-Ditylum_brightwellii.AAC.1